MEFEKGTAKAETTPMFHGVINQINEALKAQTESISSVRMQTSMLHDYAPAEESELKDRDKKAESTTVMNKLQDILRQINHNTAAVDNMRRHLGRLV